MLAAKRDVAETKQETEANKKAMVQRRNVATAKISSLERRLLQKQRLCRTPSIPYVQAAHVKIELNGRREMGMGVWLRKSFLRLSRQFVVDAEVSWPVD